MGIRTIVSGNKRHIEPLFALAIGDGRGHNYLYENAPTRQKRERSENSLKAFPRDQQTQTLYRINVYPKSSPTRKQRYSR